MSRGSLAAKRGSAKQKKPERLAPALPFRGGRDNNGGTGETRDFICLGHWWGYHAWLCYVHKTRKAPSRVRFHIGCRMFRTAREATRHWKNGHSTVSKEYRPNHEHLVGIARALAKANGWKW